MLSLIGIVILVIGFALRFNPLLVVLVAAIVTGLVSGIPFDQIMTLIGQLFLQNRDISLVIILMLPIIGILELNGLKEQAHQLIKKTKRATAGRIMLLYLFIREVTSMFGLDIGGHAQSVRLLLALMAEGIAVEKHGPLSPENREKLLAHTAAVENTGRFFGEDIFIATGAILLMKSFFNSVNVTVSIWSMALWGLPTAMAAFGIAWYRLHRLDQHLAKNSPTIQVTDSTLTSSDQQEVSR